jgi:rhodanese-related sulfurtransferase
MSPILIVLSIVAVALIAVGYWLWRRKRHFELTEHSITPDELHGLIDAGRGVLVYDVRQPLDLLADSEIIPGALRIAPQEILDDPSVLPRESDFVVYCTCPSDKTSRAVLDRALSLGIRKVRFLKGGLAGWKARGFTVVPYDKPFHLNTIRS